MPRVGTCKDCNARFKIPDSVTATRAKCKKCGGVVEIPTADAAAEAGSATKPAAKAPVKRAGATAGPARRAKTAGAASAAKSAPGRPSRKAPAAGGTRRRGAKQDADTGDSEDAAKPTKGRRASAGARRGASKGRGGRAAGGRHKAGADDKQSSPLVPLLIVAVVVLGGGFATWWFGFRDDGGTTNGSVADDAATETGETGSEDAAGTDTSDTDPDVDDILEKGDVAAAAMDGDGGAQDDDGDLAPPPTVGTGTAEGDEPEALDTVISMDPFGPTPGTDAALFTELSADVNRYYIEGTGPITAKKLRAKLAEADFIVLTPIFINTLNGLDMAAALDVKNAFKLVFDWQNRVAGVPHFFFDGDVNAMEVKDINTRVNVIAGKDGIHKWWAGKVADPETAEAAVEAYRQKVIERRAQKRDDDEA